jgi:tetratricopeptide (TPR) repeat protein
VSDSAVIEPPGSGPADPQPLPAGISADAVREALARVLEADELRPSPQLSNILRFVVQATLDGRQDAIKGYTIAVEALGRDPSFDPQADPIVRVEATRLRRSLERYYAGAGANDDIEIMVPRGSYVPQFRLRREAAGIAPGLTPGSMPGVEEVPDATGDAGVPRADRWRPRWPLIALFALVILAIAAGGVMEALDPLGWRALIAGSAPHPLERANRLGIPMVEVRSFEATGTPTPANASGPPEFDPRALEVRVRDALARFDLVDVLATPDARPALDCGAAPAAASSAFSLGGLVENHEDGSVSVLLRLSDVCDGTIVWSREFESLKRGDPTGTEVALVRDIMSAIAEPYGIIQARARARAAAAGGVAAAGPYGCVLLAYGYWRSYAPAEHASARECLERALAADDTFALGHALLAELYLDEVRTGAPAGAATPALNRALTEAEQAVELAPTSAYARRVLMDVHFFRGERGQAMSAGEAAIELNPYDVDVIADVGGRLIAFGEIERGEALLASARSVAPGAPPWVDYHRVIAAYLRGDASAASAAADHLMGEGYAPGLLARALAEKLAGETDAARADLHRLVTLAPAWGTETDAMISRFFPDPAIAKRVRSDLASLGLPAEAAAR